MEKRRIAIIGSGPIGLEAALYGMHAGFEVKVYERGPLAANVSSWGHVRMVTTWRHSATPLGLRCLDELALDPPDPDTHPTGEELVHCYLEPISSSPRLAGRLLTDTRVVRVTRESQIKQDWVNRPEDRRTTPFRLLVHDGAQARIEHADVVLDASGTYGNPVGFGAGGMNPVDAPRYTQHIDRILHDIEGISAERYGGKHVLLVGSGYAAANQALALEALASRIRGTRTTWVTREEDGWPVRPVPDDPLPARRRLRDAACQLATDPLSSITPIRSAYLSALRLNSRGSLNVDLIHEDGSVSTVVGVDVIIALTGYRPDLDLDEELQVARCHFTEAPLGTARALHDAGADEDQFIDSLQLLELGPEVLRNPEPDFYCLGAKSFGRNPSFLLPVGHAQVRDVFRLLTGNGQLDLYSVH